jgi:predicted TIM-barrel fold metal-dependent hydrolase
VLDHVGLNVFGKGPWVFEDLPAVCALAKRPNIAVKASGMPSFSTEGYPFRNLHPHIRTLVEAFGPRRTFWGTDLTRMPCTYYEGITLFTEHLLWRMNFDDQNR